MTNNNNPYNQHPQGEQMPPSAPIPPQMGMPMSRRARWGKQLMAGSALIKQSLPDWFATYAIGFYAVALLGVNLLFSSYSTEWYFWLFGIVWVAGFFLLSVKYSREWNVSRVRKAQAFEKKLFGAGLALRLIYAIFIFYFYISMTGAPHEYGSADSSEYLETALWYVQEWQNGNFGNFIFDLAKNAISDMGYPLSLMIPVAMFEGDSAVFIVLILQAFIGAFTPIIIYRLTKRSMGEIPARMAAIFCMLHPVLICYCGMTLKEVLMTFLLVLFIDIADRLLRNKRYTFSAIAPLVLIGLSLFLFRTVLGMIAFMAVFFALVMMDTKIVSWGRKVILGILLTGVVLLAASDTIIYEINQVTSANVREQQETSLEYRYGEKKGKKGVGNSLVKYAGTAVFAPLIFTLPFPTMVNAVEGQADMRLIHGGNWMRNVMSGFVILAMFMLLLTGDWRKYTLPLAMMLGYLLMLSFTQFAHSLRFHIPVMPFEMMFAAYAITNMRKKHKNWYLIWCLFMVVTCFAWNWFKLAGRGLT